MKIREATAEDIPQIIQVLKLSMGETELPLSESIWQFKHILNPFGSSPVFVTVENGRIAGVRAFMQWKWQKDDHVFLAYRAVDTATHPDFQGKGIFKKLTSKAVEYGTEINHNFVFNTPNEKSRPGYLKMGWNAVGKLNVALQPAFQSFWRGGKEEYQHVLEASSDEIEDLCIQWNEMLKSTGKIFTPKSYDYLNWRYINNPLQRYQVLATPNFFLAGYIKKRGSLKELRISECIFVGGSEVRRAIEKVTIMWSKKFGVHFISYSPELNLKKSFTIKANIGPILTVRELNLDTEDRAFVNEVENWKYSLGDLELF